MRVKVSLNGVLFLVYTLSILFSGIIAEGISSFCLLTMAIIERTKIRKKIGHTCYDISVIIIFLFFFMSYIQFKIGNVKTGDMIRLIGLTKGICAPALFLITYSSTAKKDTSLDLLIILVITLNIIYTIQALTQIEWLTKLFVLGSQNGCSGTDVVMLAVIVPQIQNGNRKLHKKDFLFIISSYINIIASGSYTSIMLVMIETALFIMVSPRYRTFLSTKRKKKLLAFIIVISLIGALGFIYNIANGTLKMSGDSLGTRVGIWRQGFRQFSFESRKNRILGTGSDYVQMLTQRLEAHNFLLEIVLLYGYIGLATFIISAYIIIRNLIRKLPVIAYDVLLPLSMYIIICMMHPFFTGVFPFQWFCVSAILYTLMNENRETICNEGDDLWISRSM